MYPCSISLLTPGVGQTPHSSLQLSWMYEVDLKWKSMMGPQLFPALTSAD